jgi:hypothetical protein
MCIRNDGHFFHWKLQIVLAPEPENFNNVQKKNCDADTNRNDYKSKKGCPERLSGQPLK